MFILGRLALLLLIVFATFIGLMMAGFAGDSGVNIYVYLIGGCTVVFAVWGLSRVFAPRTRPKKIEADTKRR